MARVLVVEDHEDSARYVAKFLTFKGHACTCVGSGWDAIAAVTRGTPDVILLDLNMPQMDGVEFLQVLAGRGSPSRSCS
jgi:CheY-like chemotaxis protein